MTPKIIAFCGSKGSGKSTSSTIFKEMFSGPTEELAFAGHLKNVCSEVFGLDMKYFLDPDLKEVELEEYPVLTRKKISEILKKFDVNECDFDTHVRPHMGVVFHTPREVLQYVGTNLLHPIDKLIHVKITMKLKDPNKVSIITDLRFPQEFDALAQQEGFIPFFVSNVTAEAKAAADSHASERSVLLFKDKCQILDNNGSIQDLRTKIQSIVDTYFKE